jgi:hypothetical protein
MPIPEWRRGARTRSAAAATLIIADRRAAITAWQLAAQNLTESVRNPHDQKALAVGPILLGRSRHEAFLDRRDRDRRDDGFNPLVGADRVHHTAADNRTAIAIYSVSDPSDTNTRDTSSCAVDAPDACWREGYLREGSQDTNPSPPP